VPEKTNKEIEKKLFSKRLKEALVYAKIEGTQAEVGKMFGLSQPSYGDWLNGTSMPDIANAVIASKILNVSFEWLMTGRGEKELVSGNINPNTKALLHAFLSLSDYNQKEVIAYAKGRQTIGDPPDDSVAQQAQAINDALDILDEEGMLTLTNDERVRFIEVLILAKIGSEPDIKRAIINHIKTKVVS